jgi:hypothetical protein
LDAPVSPSRVLPGQPPDQLTDLLWDRRAPGGIRRGPLVPHHAPVPGEQRGGRHDPVQPQALRQQPRERGNHGTVGPVRFRAGDLAAQDCDSCRSTKISTSLEVSLRASSTTQPNNRIMSR